MLSLQNLPSSLMENLCIYWLLLQIRFLIEIARWGMERTGKITGRFIDTGGHPSLYRSYIFANQILLVFYNPPGSYTDGADLSSRFWGMIFQGISNMPNDPWQRRSIKQKFIIMYFSFIIIWILYRPVFLRNTCVYPYN